MMDFLISMLRTLFFSLDKVVFGLIDDVYGLLLQLTRTSIFDQDAIHEFSKRVYALVGIFMLFKVSVSIINYILNPDDFTDKEKGFGSIIKHVILSLVMVVLVPYIFNEAYDLQSIILRENTIMNLVFGSPSGDVPRAANSSYSESAGKKIQFTLLYAFAHPNYDDFANDTTTFDLIDCKETYDTDENGQYKFRLKPVFGTNNQSGALSSYIYELRPTCWGVYNAENDSYEASGANGTLLQAFDSIDASIAYQNYAQGVAQQSFTLFFRKEAILAKIDDGRYLIDYKFGISTAIGVGTLYLFLLFCIDIAVRSIKLGFLQMIAPIPIISYCDPKSGKDGMFKKWLDMSVKTYLELFIRLFALYFGIYIITLVGAFKDIVTGEIVDNKLVMVFMILGVLIFIKKLPDIIKDVFNVKGDGKFQLNPLKKIEDEAIGGKKLVGAGKGVAAAGLAGAAALGTNLIASKGNPFSALAGGFSAAGRGLLGATRGEKFSKNFSNSYSGAMKARQNRDERQQVGVNGLQIAGQRARQTMGISTRDQIQDAQLKRYEEAINYGKAAKTRAEGEIDKRADQIDTSTPGVTLGALRDKAELLKNMSAQDYATSHGLSLSDAANELAKLSSKANAEYYSERKKLTDKYIEHAEAGTLSTSTEFSRVFKTEDIQVQENVKHMKSTVDTYGLKDSSGANITVSAGNLSASMQSLEDSKTSIQGSDEYRKSHLIAEQAKKQ